MFSAGPGVEQITQAEFQKRLGVSPAYLASRKDIKEWLVGQPGVTRVNARRLAIPDYLVETARLKFAIRPRVKKALDPTPQPAPKRGRGRASRSSKVTVMPDYTVLPVDELLEHKRHEEELLAGVDTYSEQIERTRNLLEDLQKKQVAAVDARKRLDVITRTIKERQQSLDAQADRIARERELLANQPLGEE